jgi:hypothetical protein
MLETEHPAMRAPNRPAMTREEVMETLMQMRSSFFGIFANQFRADGIIPLPRNVIDHLTRAEQEVAQAGEEILDIWDMRGDAPGTDIDAP